MDSKNSHCTYLCPESPTEWRLWLECNAARLREIWLLFPKKSSNRKGISYMEALEEALCFGWIDGMVRRYDEHCLSQRFTPRAAKSSWSEVNKQHARLLIQSGKMTELGARVLPELDPEKFPWPEDIIGALRADAQVWENFCAFPRFYQNIRLAAIDLTRNRLEIFQKRLRYFIEKTRKNLRFGRFT